MPHHVDHIFPPDQAAGFLERLLAHDPVDGPTSVIETPLGLAALASHVLSVQCSLRAQLDARGGSLARPADERGDPATRAIVDEHRRRHPRHERSLALAVAAFDLADLCDERTLRAYGSLLPALARDPALCRLERVARRLYRLTVPPAARRFGGVAAAASPATVVATAAPCALPPASAQLASTAILSSGSSVHERAAS